MFVVLICFGDGSLFIFDRNFFRDVVFYSLILIKFFKLRFFCWFNLIFLKMLNNMIMVYILEVSN